MGPRIGGVHGRVKNQVRATAGRAVTIAAAAVVALTFALVLCLFEDRI